MKRELPEGWRWSTLGEECEINPRRTKDLGGNDNQETSFVPMEAVDGDKGIISEIRIVPFSKVKKGYTYFEENDVLFAKITPCMQNKKSVIANGLINGFGFGTTEFHVLRCKDRVIPKWIYYFIRNQRFIDEAEKNFTGAVGQQRVPAQFIEKFRIPVPSISEQQKIVEKLDRQMAQIEIMKKATERQRDATENIFLPFINEILTRYSSNSKTKKIKDVIEICYGKSLSEQDRKKGNIPVYGSNGIVGYHTERLIDFDTIIIGRKGSAGEINYVDEPSWPIDTTYYIKTIYNLKYIFYLLMSLELSKIKQRGVKPGLNRDDAYDLPINFVDNLSEQEEIARILNHKSKEIEMLNHQIINQLKAINQLPASILNEVFGQYQINS